jgi:acetoin utilization deacetylase AcuC-like enzyme
MVRRPPLAGASSATTAANTAAAAAVHGVGCGASGVPADLVDTHVPQPHNGNGSGDGDGDDSALSNLDGDTTVSSKSWVAAMRAAGIVTDAVDAVCGGKNRNAFCAVRPPGT